MIKIVKDNVKEVLAGIRAMESRRVYIGVPGEASERGQAINNASLAYIHDNGSPKVNIPARPFLRPGIESVQGPIAEDLKLIAMSDSMSVGALDAGLERAGLRAQAAVKKQIVSQEGFVALSPKTLKRRQKKGFAGTKALIETGKLLNSIKYVVRSR